MFLKQKVPLERILDLCPRFKAKILRKEIRDLNAKLKATIEGATCNMVQSIDLPKRQDAKVAKINLSINQNEQKGVVLDGIFGVNVKIEDIASMLSLKWEPIAFNVRTVDSNTILAKGII